MITESFSISSFRLSSTFFLDYRYGSPLLIQRQNVSSDCSNQTVVPQADTVLNGVAFRNASPLVAVTTHFLNTNTIAVASPSSAIAARLPAGRHRD
jgi:hypothetical protein